jgi:hypothetical protein
MHAACEIIGILSPAAWDRFVTHALEWLVQKCTVEIEFVGDGYVVRGHKEGKPILVSPDERLAWAFAGAIHAFASWSESVTDMQEPD